MADAAILKIVGHNSSAECPISVKFCAGKQFFTEYRQWEIYSHVAQNSFLVFIMQFRLQRVGAFCIVSDTQGAEVDFVFAKVRSVQKCKKLVRNSEG